MTERAPGVFHPTLLAWGEKGILTINCYKVHPGKIAEYRALAKSFAVKYYQVATAKPEGPLSWSPIQVVMPGGSSKEAGFVGATHTQGAPRPVDGAVAKQTTGMTFAECQEKARPVYSMVRSEVLLLQHRRGAAAGRLQEGRAKWEHRRVRPANRGIKANHPLAPGRDRRAPGTAVAVYDGSTGGVLLRGSGQLRRSRPPSLP